MTQASSDSPGIALIALDLDGDEQRVLARGLETCARLGLRARAAYVFDYDEARPSPSELAARIRELVERAASGPPTPVREDLVRGRGASALCAHAEVMGASLILLGSNRRHGARRLLFGDFAQRVVDLARCDVFVIHETPRWAAAS